MPSLSTTVETAFQYVLEACAMGPSINWSTDATVLKGVAPLEPLQAAPNAMVGADEQGRRHHAHPAYSTRAYSTHSSRGRRDAIPFSVRCSPRTDGGSAAAQSTPARPNVVVVVMDDVGYGDVGSYGAPDVKTPNVDRLAREGTRFTDFYAAPTCSPMRTQLMSGRYLPALPDRTAARRPCLCRSRQGAAGARHSLPQLLKNSGYATGLVGKWHLGYKPEFQPNAHGFDYFFGFLSGYIDYYQHTDGGGNHDFFENGQPIHPTGYSTDLITEKSVAFIEANAGKPFFLEVAYNAAHWPFQVPDHPSVAPGNGRFVQPQEPMTSTRRDYVAIVERADRGLGTILDTLERRGLASNTLVFYTHDNGGEWLSRNTPLFHRKDSVWEGGIRVPLIARWPGQIPKGKVLAQVGITMDVTATILAAGVRPSRQTRVRTASACCRSSRARASRGADALLPQRRRRPPAAGGASGRLEGDGGRPQRDGLRPRQGSRGAQRPRARAAGRGAAAASADRGWEKDVDGK
jgi:arylsulfatase A-like enzyme